MCINVLKIMPKFLLAKLTFADMWSLKVNLLSIITPKSFSFATFSMACGPLSVCMVSRVKVIGPKQSSRLF